jgi:hypothetical protein
MTQDHWLQHYSILWRQNRDLARWCHCLSRACAGSSHGKRRAQTKRPTKSWYDRGRIYVKKWQMVYCLPPIWMNAYE